MRGAPQSGFAVDISQIRTRMSRDTRGRPRRCRLFHVQNSRSPRRCHAMTVSGLTMCTAERQPLHGCESQTHNARSADVRRRRGCLDRFTTPSWCRSAMISRCSEARERTMNWSECSSETRTQTNEGYRRTSVTSIRNAYGVFSRHTFGKMSTESDQCQPSSI